MVLVETTTISDVTSSTPRGWKWRSHASVPLVRGDAHNVHAHLYGAETPCCHARSKATINQHTVDALQRESPVRTHRANESDRLPHPSHTHITRPAVGNQFHAYVGNSQCPGSPFLAHNTPIIIYPTTVADCTKVLENYESCRPTSMAPKGPQNPLVVIHITFDNGICEQFELGPEKWRTSQSRHLDRRWLNLQLFVFEVLRTSHHAKRAPQFICTDSPRLKMHSHGDSSLGLRRMRGQSPT
jgi:hypothetical protein